MATKRYRLGVAGLVHDHVWNELKHWAALQSVDIVAAADPNEPLLERVAAEYGVKSVYKTPSEMFERENLDIVQVCTSNAAGVAVVEEAARHKVNAVVEKPMASDLAGADRMLRAVQSAGTRLMINWPFRWRAATVQAWQLVSGGVIGDVFHSRIRMAHKGPREFGCSEYFCNWLYDAQQNGGGAVIDYCCYGAVAFRHLFGRPESVQAVAARLTKDEISVDDNAAITLIYENRIAVTEASWSQIPSYHDSVYLGTEGTLWTDEGKLFVADESRGQREIPVQPLTKGEHNGPEYFLACLEDDREFTDVCSPVVCRDAQEILQAGVNSNSTGRRIELPL